MTKIIQISDTHIVPDGHLAYNVVDTATPLAECVETINRMLPEIGPVDMVVVTGDLTDFGSAEEYHRFRTILKPLAIPYCVIPGNHDHRETVRDCFSDQEWMPKSGPINWMLEFADLVLIGLDTSVEGCAYGHLDDISLAFLEDRLERIKSKSVLVAIHHPPIFTGKENMDRNNLRDCERLKEILSTYQGEVKLICGHIHRNIVSRFGNVICQIAPGTSHAVALNQQTNAQNCLIKEPGGFLLHEMRGGIVSHHIPIGKFDGPYPFYPKIEGEKSHSLDSPKIEN